MNCQHEGCKCQVEQGQEYCSEYCRQHSAEGHEGHTCDCGHPACT
jgi:hypothetical protein